MCRESRARGDGGGGGALNPSMCRLGRFFHLLLFFFFIYLFFLVGEWGGGA